LRSATATTGGFSNWHGPALAGKTKRPAGRDATRACQQAEVNGFARYEELGSAVIILHVIVCSQHCVL
jgi:hypothetical protein